jgi:hypothetical protein
MRQIYHVVLLILIFIICSYKSTKENNINKIKIIDNRIGETEYFISLPESYFIESTVGDGYFLCYIIKLSGNMEDTQGGFYFGNDHSMFYDENKENNYILNEIHLNEFSVEWKIYDTIWNNFYAESIIENNNFENLDGYWRF